MSEGNYPAHDAIYRSLRNAGQPGWGGPSFEARMRGWARTVEALVHERAFPPPPARVLELGSGAGDALLPFAKLGYQVTGIEISPAAVAWSREKFADQGLSGRFVEGTVTELASFGDEEFDAILDGACLHCIIGADRRQALDEAFRTLRRGGFFLLSHMANDPRELPPGIKFEPATRCQLRDGVPYRAMPTSAELEAEVEGSGFEVFHRELRSNPWWDHFEAWCRKP